MYWVEKKELSGVTSAVTKKEYAQTYGRVGIDSDLPIGSNDLTYIGLVVERLRQYDKSGATYKIVEVAE